MRFGSGGGRWKLLHVSPESGSWTAAFLYPKGASVPSHIHVGPGEYFMVTGKLEVRGGDGDGGVTATAPCFSKKLKSTCGFKALYNLLDPMGKQLQ